ncbi:16S rRNA methyltransferase GidB, partial [gut metagenome]
MINKERLEGKAEQYGIALTGTMLDRLDKYAECLVEYNQKVNLTAITDPEGIEDKHFIDS